MGTDILKEQYNLLLENQKKKIKKLQDKRVSASKINGFDIDTNDDALNIEKEIDKLNEVDFMDSSSDELNINTKTSINKKPGTSTNIKINSLKKTSSNVSENDSATLRESLSYSDKLRELKDENGRLRKLLSEKEYEINHLKKKLEEEKLAFTGGGVGSDAIALKIVELSKRIRELNSELEMEKTKNKQLNKLCKDFEYKLSTNNKNRPQNDDDDVDEEEDETQKLTKENKDLKEKLNQTSGKMMEFKSQCEILKQDLKKYQRALEKEVGDNVDIKAILNGQSNWKGRQQQIRALQHKLNELKQQIGLMDNRNTNEMILEEDFESQFMKTGDIGSIGGIQSQQASMTSFSTSKRSALDAKNREEIKKIEKEKKEQVEKVKREYEALENDYNTIKSKQDAFKARNTVLTNEVKALKEQVKTLLEKGKHDDELIEALLQKQNQMKSLIDELTSKNETLNKDLDEKTKECQVKGMQDKNSIEQLKSILSEREKRVKQLEEEVKMIQIKEQSNKQLEFILHGGSNNNSNNNNNNNNNMSSNHTLTNNVSQTSGLLINDENNNERLGSSLSTRNNSRNELTSTRLGSSSGHNITNSAKNNNNNSRLSGREVASTRQALKNTKLNSRPNSANSNHSFKKEYEELKLEYHELLTLNKSNEIERTRLMELVKILQKRLEGSSDKLVETDNKYNEQRRRCVGLEKQLEKLKLDSNTGNKQKNTASTMMAATLDQYKIEELETSLLIQKDENDALKAALKSTLEAKEEDLRLYVEMLESTKRVFLDGLKEFKQIAGKN